MEKLKITNGLLNICILYTVIYNAMVVGTGPDLGHKGPKAI